MKKLPIMFSKFPITVQKTSMLFFVVCVLLCFNVTDVQASVYDQILKNIYNQEVASVDIVATDKQTHDYLAQLTPEGAFPDINYTSRAHTYWEACNHVIRMQSMVISYISPSSTYYGDEALHTALVNMLTYWDKVKPTSTNWWFVDIFYPQHMGLNLSLLRAGKKKVPAEVENNILNSIKEMTKRPDAPGSPGTGANKMDIALQWIYRTCLQEDKENLEFAIQQFYYPIQYNEVEGIQSDLSYRQHGRQLYIGGYGASVLDAFFKVAFYLQGTPYENLEANALISDFVRMGYMPAVRGSYMLHNSIGRGFARKEGTNRKSFAASLKKMSLLDAKHKKLYQKGVKRMQGEKGANYGLKAFNRHYWRSDYAIHQRPSYTMDVRLASTRLSRCENGNGENIKGYFMTDGGTAIVRTGEEYVDIYPVWDWTRLPGTTTPVLPEVPQPKQWGTYTTDTFVGGVSDGVYGISTCQLNNKEYNINTAVTKSWFFFDNEVVCMGSNIQSTNANPINTTINQCLAKGDVTVAFDNASTNAVMHAGDKQTSTHVTWVNHDGISYYFPEGGLVTVQNNKQSGSWNRICSNIKDTQIIQKDVFKLWLDHGVQPLGATYMYYIVPNTTTIKQASKRVDNLITINTDSIQAVYNRSLQILSIVFHKPGKLQVEDFTIQSSQACAVMLRNVNKKTVNVYLSDPSYALDSAHLVVKFPQFNETKHINCTFNKDIHYLGSPHTFTISKHTVQ